MATRKYKFKHIAADATTHVGDVGELILNTSSNTLKVSDGTTPGGVTLNTDGSPVPVSTVVDADGGAIDYTKDVVFLTAGQNYTLANGDTTGHTLNLVVNGGTTGAVTITVAKAKYTGSGTVNSATNYSWQFNTGAGISNTMATRRCIWDGTHWVLDNA